jgi:bifunctional DNA-binding transcriptional regulator/antitoxin component of YhaV-PrlF toxin-antitoxin module
MSGNEPIVKFEARLFGNGRITIDKPVRDKLKLKEGARVLFGVMEILDYNSAPSKPRNVRKKKKESI